MSDDQKAIAEAKKEWEQRYVSPALKRFNLTENPTRFYNPLDLCGFDFLKKSYRAYALNRSLPCRINIQKDEEICIPEGSTKFIHQVSRPCISVRLEKDE